MKTNPIFCLILSLTILVALVSPMSQAGLLLWGFGDKAHEKDWEVVNGQWEVKNGVFEKRLVKIKPCMQL